MRSEMHARRELTFSTWGEERGPAAAPGVAFLAGRPDLAQRFWQHDTQD